MRRGVLARVHERVLHHIVGIFGRAGDPIGETPQECSVVLEPSGDGAVRC